MARLTPRFSTTRTVREYTERYYLSAAAAYRSRGADKAALGKQIVQWKRGLDEKWATLRFGELKVGTYGDECVFEVQVYLSALEPTAVRVELYADGVSGGAPVRQEMRRIRQLVGAPGGFVYSGTVSAARPPGDYTTRVMPHGDGVAVPLEEARILWRS
jgi:starch phosphorylase